MSTPTEAAIAALNASFIANCILSVACTLYFYERCIIFDREWELIWRRKASLASVVYGIMHLSMFTTLWSAVALLATSSCEALSLIPVFGYVLGITEISSKIVFRWAIGGISALRVYAINGRKLGMPVAILLLFLTYTLYDFYNASSLFKEPAPPPVDCILLSAMQPDVQHGLKISGLVCAAVAEVLVLAATWRATYRARRASDSSSTKTSVSAMLLRDGTVYFGVILLLLIANAVLELVATDVSITSLTYVLQTVCITHLYINLRHAASSNTLPGEDSQIHVSFSRVLGTLDGSLVFGSDGYASDGAVIDNALALYVTSMGGKTEGIAMLNMASSERSSDLDASLALKQGSLDMCARAV